MDTRVIVLCAGDQAPWPGWLGPPKQLVTVEGEVLLHRTVRLVREHTDDVVVTAKLGAEGFEVEGARTYYKTPEDPQDLYGLVGALADPEKATVVLFGDCWYDEEAIATIFEERPKWTAFQRAKSSALTGCPYGEVWAIRFLDEHLEEFQSVTRFLRKLAARRAHREYKCWDVIKRMSDPETVEINSWVEDFDFQDDLRRWEQLRCTRS